MQFFFLSITACFVTVEREKVTIAYGKTNLSSQIIALSITRYDIQNRNFYHAVRISGPLKCWFTCKTRF